MSFWVESVIYVAVFLVTFGIMLSLASWLFPARGSGALTGPSGRDQWASARDVWAAADEEAQQRQTAAFGLVEHQSEGFHVVRGREPIVRRGHMGDHDLIDIRQRLAMLETRVGGMPLASAPDARHPER